MARSSAFVRRLTAGLLVGTCLSPLGASGQTWQGATSDYFTSSNWNPATVPTNAGTTATFDAAGVSDVSIGSGLTIGTFAFTSNAQAYTINITGGGIQFRNGSGIVNNSSAVQTIRSDVAGAAISFDAGSTAANATVISTVSNINFTSNSTGGTATVSATSARINVGNTASLQNATVNIANFGSLRFLDTGSGGQASVTLTSGSELLFQSYTGAGTTIGSLSGDGTVNLGTGVDAKALAIGGNNQSTVFSGTISQNGSIEKTGSGTLTLSGNNGYTGGTTLTSGTLAAGSNNALGTGGLSMAAGTTLQAAASSVLLGNGVTLNGTSTVDTQANTLTLGGVIDGGGTLAKSGAGTLALSGANTYTGGTAITEGTLAVGNSSALGTGALTFSNGTTLRATAAGLSIGNAVTLAATSAIDTQENILVMSGTLSGGAFTKTGNGTLVLNGTNTYSGATVSAGTLQGTTDSLRGNILNNAAVSFAGGGTYAGDMSGSGSLTKVGPGALILTGSNSYGGTTTVSDGTLAAGAANVFSSNSAVGVGTDGTLALQAFDQAIGSLTGTGTVQNGGTTAAILTAGGNNASTTFGGTLRDGGAGALALAKTGTGTLTLDGTSSYSGGTTVSGGTLQGTSSTLQGNITNNAAVVFNQTGSGTYAGNMSGSGSLTLQGGGTLTLTGTNGLSGTTTVEASTLVVNGSLAGAVALNAGSTLGGSGTIGGLVANGATLMPGNSIGTLNINGNFSQSGGVYQVEANAQGQSDRIVATGTATIGGGATVQVLAQSGNYATRTTYTILTAAGGVSGAYSGVTSNFAFLTPSLSYDANNVFLTLALQGNAFSGFGGNTPNQRSVGYSLDQSYANASGDFATVVGALANLSTTQAGPALDAISGQQYADFGTTNVNTSAMFMNTLGQQMALARGASAGGQRVALAQACEVEACDTARLLSAWFSGLGGLGSVQSNTNASTLTYNFGGAAAGIDYRLSPNLLLGLGVGYTHGTQWVNSFMGQGWSDSVSVAAYGSFTQAGFYADALAGYAYFNNQMQRQIQIPGLQPRTATGSTGTNQFLTQIETGYALPVFGAKLAATPFARLQFSTTTQNAFNESGANSLSLNVAQQTTNSLRTVFGAELASNLPLTNERSLGLALRLGWQHEYADTGRPITAAFSGAPSASFTVYGATPTRDAAIVGFSANTTVVEATELYLRYDGTLASGTDNHAFTAGLRLSW